MTCRRNRFNYQLHLCSGTVLEMEGTKTACTLRRQPRFISYDVHLPDVGLAYGLQRERVVEGLLGATKEAITGDSIIDTAEE